MMSRNDLGIYIYGQIISIFISIMVYANTKIGLDNPTSWPYALFFIAYLINYLTACGVIYCKKIKSNNEIPWYRYFLSGLSNFLGDFFQFLAYLKMTSYFVVLFSQLLFPKLVLIETLVLNKPSISLKKLISFLLLIVFCFTANLIETNEKINVTFMGFFIILLSNVGYMINIYNQAYILNEIDIYHFIKKFSIFTMISGFFISLLYPNTIFNPLVLLEIYNNNFINLILYLITYTAFQITTSLYIARYGAVAFNASIISYSAYFGFMLTMAYGDISKYAIVLYGLCIITDLILVSTCKTNDN